MDFSNGYRLGSYDLIAQIGVGGMGEVWKARDNRLDRVVAIKRLKPEHVGRFEKEARSIAALNHPHVCQIYDVGPDYLVLEYIDGQPLRGPLPVEEAVRLAIQIASALETAHSFGMLHRDLKPANILVTQSGIKLLDFGLAKTAITSDIDTTQTVEGTVLGTAAYMSPEQAQGKPLDERSDIFALGAVLYEMLSGTPAFPGGSVLEIMSAVLRDDPPPTKAPESLQRIVARCLRKDRADRFQSMSEVKAALEQCLPERLRPAKGRAFWTPVAVAAALVMAGFAVWLGLHRASARGSSEVRQLTTNSGDNPVWSAIVSPDGRYIADGDASGIQVRLISTGESHLLPRPRNLSAGDAWFPVAWHPDGARILANSMSSRGVAAWTISLVGGDAALLRDQAMVQSASPDGSLIAFTAGNPMTRWATGMDRRLMWEPEIWIMGPRGENAKRVVSAGERTWFNAVRWSPSGKRLAYQKLHPTGGMLWDYTIESSDLDGGKRSVLLSRQILNVNPGMPDDVSFADTIARAMGIPNDFCWLRDGRIIFDAPEAPPNVRDSNLWEWSLDNDAGNVRGQPRRLTSLSGFHMEEFSVTADGRKLVFESAAGQSHVVVGRLAGAGKLADLRRLTLDQRYNVPFAWTPDSKAIIFTSDRTGTFSIYKQALDQSVPELIPVGPGNVQMVRVSPDGASLLYTAILPNSQTVRVMRVPISGGAPQALLTARVNNIDCPRRGPWCMASVGITDRDVAVLAIDVASGTAHELFRLARSMTNINFTVSPEGSRLAMTGADPQGRIEIRSLTGQIEKTIDVKGWSNPSSVDWAADGNALFVSHTGLMESPSGPVGATLLRVDLQGHVQPLWETRGGRYTWSIASPDGKYLAIREPGTERNAWMIENF